MKILLTNDDGVLAPGLVALEGALRQLGEVSVVAPASEQSGVGHSITYMTPLTVKEVFRDGTYWGWAVDGTPADCVKVAVSELFDPVPDLVVSGINSGLNAGINVLYSGTVAGAVEGAFFGVPSIAVSLEFEPEARYGRAAEIAAEVIQYVVENRPPEARLFSLNIPTLALDGTPEVHVAAMDSTNYWERLERRVDPFGRVYYWPVVDIARATTQENSDLATLRAGHVTLTPLNFDLTHREALREMRTWTIPVRSSDPKREASQRFPSVEMRKLREFRSGESGSRPPADPTDVA